jgi:hypothetical protein
MVGDLVPVVERIAVCPEANRAPNRVLYPGAKQLLTTVATVQDQHEGFVSDLDDLRRGSTPSTSPSIHTKRSEHTDWGIEGAAVPTRFTGLDEWTWMIGHPEHDVDLDPR